MKQFIANKRPPKLDHQELTKSSFWVGQIVVVVATVVGVYLAAIEGLNQALTFDYLSTQTDNYHLQRSLADEYQDNLRLIANFEEKLQPGNHYNRLQDNLELDLFIWETMKYSKTTMETPSEILTGVRRTYLQAQKLSSQLKQSKIGIAVARERLQEIQQNANTNVLPAINNSIEHIKANLQEAGVTL